MATDYKGLLTLAKAQGIGNEQRGACKLCGCLGHLTKKCTNVLTGHTATRGIDVVLKEGAAGAATDAAAGATRILGLLPDLENLSDLSSSSSDSDSSSDSGSSDSGGERKRKRSHKDKKHSKGSKSKKSKKVRGRERVDGEGVDRGLGPQRMHWGQGDEVQRSCAVFWLPLAAA